MALCTIPIQAKKIGGDLKYTSLGSTDGIIYELTSQGAADNFDVRLISNESLYREITNIFGIFDDKKLAIKLFSEKPIWRTSAGKLNNYCLEVSKETLVGKEEIPTIIGRVNHIKSIKHAEPFELNEHNFLRHIFDSIHGKSGFGTIAQISNADPHQYTIKGELLEYLACPKCSNCEFSKRPSGLYLDISLSNQVSDQESKLEKDAQELLESLQKGGYELVTSQM